MGQREDSSSAVQAESLQGNSFILKIEEAKYLISAKYIHWPFWLSPPLAFWIGN